jgi:hypothetical protein
MDRLLGSYKQLSYSSAITELTTRVMQHAHATVMCLFSVWVSYAIGIVAFYCAKVLVECLSHLHMRNMLICISYMDFVMETVRPL